MAINSSTVMPIIFSAVINHIFQQISGIRNIYKIRNNLVLKVRNHLITPGIIFVFIQNIYRNRSCSITPAANVMLSSELHYSQRLHPTGRAKTGHAQAGAVGKSLFYCQVVTCHMCKCQLIFHTFSMSMSTSSQHVVNVFHSQNLLSLSQQNIASRQQKISSGYKYYNI